MTAHTTGSRILRLKRFCRDCRTGSRSPEGSLRCPITSPRPASMVTFAAPLGYCLLPDPMLAPAAALAVLVGDVLLYRDWPRAALEAFVTALALAVAVPFVAALGLPSPALNTAEVAALLGIAVLMGMVISRPVRVVLTVDSLTGAGCSVAFAVLALKALDTRQLAWGLLALAPVGVNLVGTGALVVREKSLDMAERLLGLPHLVAAGRMTAQDLVPFVGDLRRILGNDRLWLRMRMPCGEEWIEAAGDAVNVHLRPPEGFELFERRFPLGHRKIPQAALPDGWRAGVHVPICAPDGHVAGYLLIGWTGLSGRYQSAWMTNGVLGGAVKSTARALGAFWSEAQFAQRLEAERSRLSAVVDHSDVAVLALEEDGSIVVWNAALANMVGVSADDALYQRPEALFTLTDEDGAVVSLTAGLRGSVRLTTREGRKLWVQVSCSGPADALAPGLLTAVFVDESAQRQLEQMRHLLVMSVHHELHGPLSVIRGHGQLLGESLPGGESVADSPGAILDAVEVMHHVIGDLVHVVGPDPSVPPATAVRPVEVEPLLRRTLRALPSAAERTVVAASDGLTVHGDPVRLRQCLLLVLGNAEKYAPHGKIDITVRRQGSYGVISIADEGPGIPADEYDLIRKPYYRSPGARDQPGSGMGLHIADTVVTAMSGRMEVTAAPSGGLEVRFHLPLATDRRTPTGSLPR